MLNGEEAKTLAEVSAGTLIGELLRRYWMPIASVSELDERPIVPVRLLGTDLVLYKDRSSTYGLLGRWCPHRHFDLSYGMTEDCGIRCSYHGWRFNEAGACLEQPFEERVNPKSTFKDRIRTESYQVRAKAGLLWAYLGPAPAPLLPDWAGFYTHGYQLIAFAHLPCNWIQMMEGAYDPVHLEWLHDRWPYRLTGREIPTRRPRHTAFRWLDFEYGVVFQRKLEGSDEWQADRTVVFPNLDGAAGQGWNLNWFVPIDDTNTVVVYFLTLTSWKTPAGRVLIPPKSAVKQERIPSFRKHISLDGEVGLTKELAKEIGAHLQSQDYAAWLGSGALVDRTLEHLSDTDTGVIMFRQKLLEQARIVVEGGDPIGVIRDPEKNRRIFLPGARRNYGLRREGFPGATSGGNDDVLFQHFLPSGAPQEIKDEATRVMSSLVEGLRPDWWKKK